MIERMETPRLLGNELLQDLAAKISARAQEMFGVSPSKATLFANEMAGAVADDWGGQNIYVPMDMVGRKSMRNARMYAEFTGTNHAQLASKYGLTVSVVYRILKVQKELRAPKQGSLLQADQA